MKKKSLLEFALKDPRSRRSAGPKCYVCSHKMASKIDADIKEWHQLNRDGHRISMSWLAESHFRNVYGLNVSRQTVLRHIERHLPQFK